MSRPRDSLAISIRSILLICIVCGFWLYTQRAIASDPPNIIFILTDDQGVDAIEGEAWPNNLDCHTPRLSHLASQGRVFSQVRVNPLCSPSRACLMTGRSAFQTGVNHVYPGRGDLSESIRSLQGHEWTIAEALQTQNYDTFLVGKWHLGENKPKGQDPLRQGFDEFIDGQLVMTLDDPIETGDEQISYLVDEALQLVMERLNPDDPYALFFWTNDPHQRKDQSGRETHLWWKVDESLLPSGESYYHEDPIEDTEVDRFRAVVEALDTELGRLLFRLGVVNSQGHYREESNAVVFFLGDNGTSPQVLDYPGKGTLYEGGILVPFIVFGENVPTDGEIRARLVSHVDVHETILDVAQVPENSRGVFPRRGISFAEEIGWSSEQHTRKYQLSSLGPSQHEYQWVSLISDTYKLNARSGGVEFVPRGHDMFFDLVQDPDEQHDLIIEGMNMDQEAVYRAMRDAVVDYWPISVCEPTPLMVDVPLTDAMALSSEDEQTQQILPIGHVSPWDIGAIEYRSFLRFDIEQLDDLLPPEKTLDDVESAQIIIRFKTDSQKDDETHTGPIHLCPVTMNWFDQNRSWGELIDKYQDVSLGTVDIAPHVLPGRYGSWIQLDPNTPVSFGHDAELLDAVRYWYDRPELNFGVVLLNKPIEGLDGDQHVVFFPDAILRLTLRQE